MTAGGRPDSEGSAAGDLGRAGLWIVGSVVLIGLLWLLRGVAMMVAFALLLAYALDPLVSGLERVPLPRRLRVPRALASAAVMLGLVAALGWTLAVVAPQIAAQVASLAARLPNDFHALSRLARDTAEGLGAGPVVGPLLEQAQASLPELRAWFARWVGRLFGNVLQIVGLMVIPVLAFYLLAERERVSASALGFVPEEARDAMRAAERAVDRALASYVRGQALVCLVMGVTTGALLAAAGFDQALALGLLVGLAEILPFIGFAVAGFAIALVGFATGPLQAATGLAIYAVVNYLIGLLVTPRVMGKHLKMHPFVITVSVLAGGELLGPAGVVLALPMAAVAQALVQEFAPRPRKAGRGA